MKKYAVVILLIIFLFSGNSYYLFFKYQQHIIKTEVKNQIKSGILNSEPDLFVFNNTYKIYKDLKPEAEFTYNGLLYDIVKVEVKNGKKYVYCINDKKEEDLISDFIKHRRKHDKTLNHYRKIISNKYFPQTSKLGIKFTKKEYYFKNHIQNYKSRFVETDTPPPVV